jgi:hypothetical protein
MTHSTGLILTLLTGTLLCACTSVSSNAKAPKSRALDGPVAQTGPEMLPESAALIAQSEENRLKLQNGAAMLLDVPRVELAPEAFTRVNRLLLERRPFKDSQGYPMMGRSLETPTVLLLERMGEDCYLRLEHTHRRILIPGLSCHAIVP